MFNFFKKKSTIKKIKKEPIVVVPSVNILSTLNLSTSDGQTDNSINILDLGVGLANIGKSNIVKPKSEPTINIIEPSKNEPKVEIKAIVQQSDGQIKIELDWNDEFIRHLKKNGYTGVDDDSLIQKYVLELSRTISDDMKGDSDYE